MKSNTLTNQASTRKNLIMLSILFTIWSGFNTKAQTYPPGFSQRVVESGFIKPTVFAFAPDGRLFVAEQTGAVRIIKNGNLLARPFLKLTLAPAGERGLLGMAFDPDFNTNHYLYLYYTLFSKVNNRISRFTASGDTVVPGSETVVLDLDSIKSVNHNAGILQFGPDGTLYVSSGDNSVPNNSQNLDTYHGKILRINKDGSIPPGNPFTTGSQQRQRIWEYGMKNAYTIAFQPGTGRLFVNDVGNSSWEEVNDCTLGGFNYGSPKVEGMSTNPLYTNPLYTYPHGFVNIGEGCAITGGTFFNPAASNYPASYTGNYFFLDYCGNWIDILTLSGSTATRSNFASGISSYSLGMTVGPDGNLYYMSRADQAVYKIVYGAYPYTIRLNPVADAHVRGGVPTSVVANTNYGKLTTVLTQANAAVGANYETFVKFDLTSFSGTVSSALLRMYGGLNSGVGSGIVIEARNAADITWLDTTITWNTKPVADPTILASATIVGITKEYYDFDITSHIAALKAAGATAVTIKLSSATPGLVRATFNSKEAPIFKPQLVIVYSASPRMGNNNQTDASITQDFDLYPNPAGNFFNVALKNMVGNANLALYDIKGQLVMKKIIENSNFERIETSNLENGLYLVTITNGNSVMTKKVLLNKGSE